MVAVALVVEASFHPLRIDDTVARHIQNASIAGGSAAAAPCLDHIAHDVDASSVALVCSTLPWDQQALAGAHTAAART